MGNLLSRLFSSPQQTRETQQQPDNRIDNSHVVREVVVEEEVVAEVGLKDAETGNSSDCSNAFKSNNRVTKMEKEEAAAVKLQKVYRSYRTRRNLADCVLVAEELWLDVGDGRELNLDDCPRSTLQKQRIKYLSPSEREQYEVVIKNGKFVVKLNQQLLDTPQGSKWIFVLSTSHNLYVGEKKKGRFQHSSFLAGAAASAAGRLTVDNGILKSISPYSGHYLPTEENLDTFVRFLGENGVDMTNVERRSSDEDLSYEFEKDTITESRLNSKGDREKQVYPEKQEENSILQPNVEKEATDGKMDIYFTTHDLVHENGKANVKKHAQFQGPKESLEAEGNEEIRETHDQPKSQENVYYKKSLSSKDLENQLPELPCKEWLRSFNSRKPSESYQVGKLPSGKWTSGTGLRIGCVAAYPVELRFEALKQVNLSPRATSPYFPKGQS